MNLMHRRGHLRDDELLPPSSRSGRRVGYRFATVASLVRFERMPVREAERVVDEWSRYVRARMRQGKSAASTAEGRPDGRKRCLLGKPRHPR